MLAALRNKRGWWLGGLCFIASLGCATTPYQYGHFRASDEAEPASVVIETGEPNKTMDRMAWVAGLPSRILPMHGKINSHRVSPETAEMLKAYLEKNDLADVPVFVNHYDPAGEWRRLRENSLVAPGWRYSLGVVSWLGYTLVPNRVIGGDHYNPYTNSLHLNSDVPAIVLHEAAFAKDIHSRKRPGTYAAINELPLLSLWHQSRAAGDVLGYAQTQHDWETEREAYHVLYPRIGAETTVIASPFVPMFVGPVLGFGGAAVGYVTGRSVAAHRAGQRRDVEPPTEIASDGVQQASTTETASGGVQQATYVERLPAVAKPEGSQ